MKSRLIAFITLLLGCITSASAQSLVDNQIDSLSRNHKFIYIDGKPDAAAMKTELDSLSMVMLNFYYDQFRNFSDPNVPYFMFVSKDANLAMGLGGAVRMRAYYDWDGAQPSPGFAPYLIPMNPDPASMKHFATTPSGTCLFFRVVGVHKLVGEYQLYVEANFNGYQGRDLHLKKAYAIINNVTVGYASSTFSDPAAVPPTVDAQGPNNKLSATSTLIRYMPTIKDRWVLAVSAETPATAIAVDGVDTKKADSWIPDWAAFAQYQWGKGQHIRLSGIVRTLSYRDLVSEKNHNIAGWGVMASSVSHPISPLTLYLTASYGKGYAGCGGDLACSNYDLVGNPDKPGELYAPASFGWCAGVQYNFRPNLFVSANVSQTRYLPQHDVAPDEYKYGIASAVNIFWNPTPRVQFGAEYDFGMRRNFSGHHRSGQRVGAMCQFSF
jgi:opacity protein-like surface antigen